MSGFHDHAGHGKAGRAVISREAEQKVVAEKKGREDQQDADIISGIAGGLASAPRNTAICSGRKNPAQLKITAASAARYSAWVKMVRCSSRPD